MKRIISLFLITAMVVTLLAGCAKDDGSGQPEGSNPSGSETQQDQKKDDKKDDNKSDEKKPSNNTGSQNWWGDWNWGGNNNETGESEEVFDDFPVPEASKANDIKDVSLNFYEDGSFAFGEPSTLYCKDLTLTINAPEGASVYYTMDGTNPTSASDKYDKPLTLRTHGGSFPEAYTFRALAVLADGSKSKVAARTYLVANKLDGRFTTLIFSVSGNPAELTESPNGIFYGDNYEDRGRESEREVFVEVWRADGSLILSQFAGVRIYGGYSRQSSIKSMKLFARSSYDENNKNFKFSEFNTPRLDGSGKVIKKYDKLVLRNYGNDLQFAFIRDEISQTLCKKAGFDCYEAVLPAVIYLNGEYYGFYFLHENYCDKYFKEKFGDAEGEFIILEGGEQLKNDDDDPLTQKYVVEYNDKYDAFCEMDMTRDSNYKQLCNYIDVESYLDFFAWNIALNNWDWPNNNYKLFRYVEADAKTLAADGAEVTPDSEVFDGRWRYLVHDMDYTYGLYGQTKTQASYNTLKVVMNENDERYAPLFVKLMERKDCRNYFRNKTIEYLEGPLSEQSIVRTYKELNALRAPELVYFYKYIEQRGRKGDTTMWTTPQNLAGNENEIYEFARDRAKCCLKYMDQLLPEIE